MTAIDELCQLLDERNEEYERRGKSGCPSFHEWVGWYFNLADRAYFYEYSDGSTKLVTYRYVYNLTPEQAIAATLGRDNAGRYVGLRQGKYWERTENSNYYCGGCGWKVTDHDSYCPECGGALHKAALDSSNCTNSERMSDELGRGTCRDRGTFESWGLFTCSNCSVVFPLNAIREAPEVGKVLPPRFCPNCGARVTEVDDD